MRLTLLLSLGAALVAGTVVNPVAHSQERPLIKKGLRDDWRLEKEISAVDAGSIQIPAMKLVVWVEEGWVVTELQTEAGNVEWHVVLARATLAERPIISVDPKTGSPAVQYGAYFVRENVSHLRILRERKDATSPAWILPNADVKQTLRCSALGRMFVHEAGEWCWLTSGPSKDKPDVRIRFQHRELGGKGFGGTGLQGNGGLGQVFYGDATCQDEGDLLIATRTPSFVAEFILQAQKLKKAMADKPAPVLAAQQWFNTMGELRLDTLKGKVVLLDFWGQWCAPCVKNLPAAEALHAKYKDRGLVVVGVHSAHESERLDEFLNGQKVTFPVMIDEGATAQRYFIDAWPTYFLIDKAGKVSWGFANNPPSMAQIEQMLGE